MKKLNLNKKNFYVKEHLRLPCD